MKDSAYTLCYAAVMGLVAAGLLSGVGGLTAPYREANEQAEKVRNIMKVLGVEHDPGASAEELVEVFEREVEVVEKDRLTYYRFSPEDFPPDQKRTAVQFSGSGMWGPIAGFIALEPDMRTVAGISVYSQEETPGLGAEIASEGFQQQFRGRSIFDDAGKPGLRIMVEREARDEHEVDAITGATMTSESLERMLNETIKILMEEGLKHG